MRLTHAAIQEEPEPRSAAWIAAITKEPLDLALHHLRQLEAEGQAKHTVDEGGVMRWSLVPEEQGAAMELGAEVWMAGHYEPSHEQAKRLGL